MISRWTEQEIEFLRLEYPKYGPRYVANVLQKSVQGVKMKASLLKIRYDKFFWKQEEVAFLKKYYPRYGLLYCAQKLNRSPGSVKGAAQRVTGSTKGTSQNGLNSKNAIYGKRMEKNPLSQSGERLDEAKKL